MDLDGLRVLLHQPINKFVASSTLAVKPKTKTVKKGVTEALSTVVIDVSILGCIKWNDESEFNAKSSPGPHYYIPIKGRSMVSKVWSGSVTDFYLNVKGSSIFPEIPNSVHGVRKSQMSLLKGKSWVNLEEHVASKMLKIGKGLLLPGNYRYHELGGALAGISPESIIDPCEYLTVLLDIYSKLRRPYCSASGITKLVSTYCPNEVTPTAADEAMFKTSLDKVLDKYPMLRYLSTTTGYSKQVIEYINLVNSQVTNSREK